jgi:hypothetical protein
MGFKEWRKKSRKASEYCNEHEHIGSGINSYRRMDCEFCIWQAALKEGYNLGFEDANAGVADPELFERKRLRK